MHISHWTLNISDCTIYTAHWTLYTACHPLQILTKHIWGWLIQGADIQTHLPTSTRVWRDRSPASTLHTPGIMIWWRKYYWDHDLVEKILLGSWSGAENTTGIMIWWRKYYWDHDMVENILLGSWYGRENSTGILIWSRKYYKYNLHLCLNITMRGKMIVRDHCLSVEKILMRLWYGVEYTTEIIIWCRKY